MTQPPEILYASKQYQDWLSALKDVAMLETHNQSQAMMRAVMHQVRRYMPTDDVLAFADALPPLPRGIFIEQWRPAETTPALESPAIVAQEVFERLAPHHIPPASIVADVLRVLAENSLPGNARRLHAALPNALKPLWPNGT